MHKNCCFISLKLLILAVSFATVSSAELTIRRLPGSFLQIRNDMGANLLEIQTVSEPERIKKNDTVPQFVLGADFQPSLFRLSGKTGPEKILLEPGAIVPSDCVLIKPVVIGKKTAGIGLKTTDLNIVIADVDMLSDQGFLTTQRDENIDLLVLTFADATRLDTARINLWVSLIKTRQIALNPTGMMTEAAMNKFYKSLPTKRVLPTAVLPRLEVPIKTLQFGDRQVVLLRELK